MARRKLEIKPAVDEAGTDGAAGAKPAASTDLVKIKAITPICGTDYGAVRGGIVEVPREEAERFVSIGAAEYYAGPIETAVRLLHARGCAIRLPDNPDDELVSAVIAVGCDTVDS